MAERLVQDFELLKGVGQATARRLGEAGILSYAQLASMTPEEVAGRVPGFSVKRIAQLGWITDARRLASSSEAALPAGEEAAPTSQHYATFTVELLIAAGQVRRTRVTHVQSGADETRAGWDGPWLVDVLERRAAFDAEASTGAHDPAARPGVPSLSPLAMLTAAGADWRTKLATGEPYVVEFTLEAAEVAAQGPLRFQVTAWAKRLGGARERVGDERGILPPRGRAKVVIEGVPLSPGIYRLEVVATMAVSEPTREGAPAMEVMATREGGIFQVE